MIDENLVTVSSNEPPVINVEIISQNNEVDIEFTQSLDSILSAHNNDKNAHSQILKTIKDDINQSISTISTRLASTYTKDESNELFDEKLDVSNSSVTKQGNTFNQANKLVLLNSSAQLPALDGSLLTNVAGGGVNKFENKGTVTGAITLSADIITTAAFSGTPSITLPSVTDTTKQITCILDFTTTSASYPTISNSNLKWNSRNGGTTPNTYSTLSGVKNVLVFKSIWISGTLYWEVEYSTYGGIETTFVQPALSTDGTLGGSSFAVNCDLIYSSWYAWYAVDNNPSTHWHVPGLSGHYLTLYNPNPLKVSSINITNYNNEVITGYTIYGSNDNSNWTALYSGTNSNISDYATWGIAVNSNAFYKYHKIYVSAGYTGNAGARQVTLNAVYIA